MAPAPTVHLITITALIVMAVRPKILLRLVTAGDEGRQAITIRAFDAGRLLRLLRGLLMLWRLLMLRLLVMLTLLMLRAALLVRLLIASAIGLRIASRKGLTIARRVGLLVPKVRLALHRLIGAFVGIVERVFAVVALRFPFRAVIGVLLAKLLLRRGNQPQIMLGVLMIVLGSHRIAGGRRIASQLHVLLGHVGCRSPNLHIWTV